MIKIIERIDDKIERVKYGFKNPRIDEDTFLIAHTLDETRSNSLKAMAFYYSEFGGYERALDNYKKKYNISNYLNIDEDILKEYAIMDAIVCRRIYDRMISHMRLLDIKYPTTMPHPITNSIVKTVIPAILTALTVSQ